MLTEFEKGIAGFIKDKELFGAAEKVLLAVSGGADSTALLYAMWALKSENVFGVELIAAHINHQLRGSQADGDEDFVTAQACGLDVPITARRLDVRGFARKNKLSIETAARKLRIESLLDIARANNCNCIATAHHKNDNAETIIQRLARGTGLRGLGGIWPVRSFGDEIRFVRPLLCVRRDEIIDNLKRRNLKWRLDHTNTECTYRRNYIRHRLMPAIQQECSGSVVEQLFELSQSAQRFYGLVCSRAERLWPELVECCGDEIAMNLKDFLSQPEPIKVELVRRILVSLGSGEKDLTRGHFEGILQLAEQSLSNRKIELPNGFLVWREYRKLIFARTKRAQKSKEQIGKSVNLKVPGRTKFGNYLIEATVFEAEWEAIERFKAGKDEFVEWFDFDKVGLPLAARFRRKGDRFRPLGLATEKKVGKFLTAAKVSQQVRRKALVVADSEKIIWIWPIRISEKAKVTVDTQKILQLQITGSNSV